MASIVNGGHLNNTIRFITTMNNNLTRFWFKLTTIMMFSYVSGKQQIGNNKNAGKYWQFRLPCGCRSMMRGRLPNRAHPGLHSEPLDAAIGRVPELRRIAPDKTHKTLTKHNFHLATMVHFDR